MQQFKLTSEEIQELRAAHKAAKKTSATDAYRINTLILLGTGWSYEEVVDALLLDEETIRKYIKNYEDGGISKLLEKNYTGGQFKLSKEQIEKLSLELDSTIYSTTKEICAYVYREFGINYSISGVTALLHTMGYVYKKPKLVPANANKEAQEIFLQQFLDFMKNKKEDEVVLFADAVHPTHNSIAAYGWIKKGQDKELKSNSGRERLNIHGAMDAETFETTIIASESNINAESTIDLLKAVELHYPFATIIHIILDNARYHFSKSVQEYVATSKINLVFLPSYSPQLNLIERLWKIFKKHVINNKYYGQFGEFKGSCINFFKNQSQYLDEISSVMGDGLESIEIT